MTTATVKLWGDTVGAVHWIKGKNFAVFEFTPNFLKKGLELSPIHLSLADARRGAVFAFPQLDWQTFKGLPGMLAYSLPDDFGNSVINSWLTRTNRKPSAFNPVERLCYIGTRGMGALEYFPALGPADLDKTTRIDVDKLVNLASAVLQDRSRLNVYLNDNKKENDAALLDILRIGVSAGGAVPKAVIAINGQGNVISGQTNVPEDYDHWLIKFDGISQENNLTGKSTNNCRVEYAYYLMAKDAGIEMEDCRLLEESGRAHFMTKRFDRDHNIKKHCLSLACIGHLGWNPVNSVSYEMAFETSRMLNLPYSDHEQLYLRMVFNALTRNVDDHVKNIGYAMDSSGNWRLAPAYDITYSVDQDNPLGECHKLSINGQREDFVYDDFIDVAYNVEIKNPEAVISQVLSCISRWPRYAEQAGVSKEVSQLIADEMFSEQDLDQGLSMR
ncbi:type II toxin-antitoxin system HipA family toxin [Desulfogranum japonicum]|uniref:type II toxin-antitoxin system HipA family toxin n=1 Tax=Desulfogranum japonicum TaxID=231447 RepID=UPI00040B69AF|nr:type II toxin-antitoxin system HipA family toxin [Desulfogranum japonicum]